MKRLPWIPEPIRGHLRSVLVQWRSYKERKNSLKLLKSLKYRLDYSRDYERYLVAQVLRTSKRRKPGADHHLKYLINLFLGLDKQPSKNRSVLCVGCRDTREIKLFREAGFGSVVGIDLFSTDEAILQMDMHKMTFPNSHFDVVFSSHSLEHSWNASKALSEFVRVSKYGGVCIIEVPIRFTKTLLDPQPFSSLQTLLAVCEPFISEILFAEESVSLDDTSRVGRLMFTVKKESLPH
jgi:SAM-dependent methyltransferase